MLYYLRTQLTYRLCLLAVSLAAVPLSAQRIKLSANAVSDAPPLKGFVETLGPPMRVAGVPALAEVDLNRIRLGDFNGDGLTDFYRIEGWGTTSPGQILLNDANGFYVDVEAPAVEIRGNAALAKIDLARMRLGDFNGDGLIDFYRIEGWNSKEKGKIWLNGGAGNYKHRDAPAFFVGGDPVIAQVDINRVKLGDFNGDELTDIYYLAGSGPAVAGQIFLSQKNGSYKVIAAPSIVVSSNPAIAKIDVERVRLADFNGDGKTDIIRINGWGPMPALPSDIWISHGNGTYTHWEGPVLEVAGNPELAQLDLDRIRLDDFNGDGLPDIYRIEGLGTSIPGQIWLTLGEGKYQSVPAPAVWVGGTPVLAEVDLSRVRVADFNGDGLQDLYRINGWNTTQAGDIWINSGNNTYRRIDAPSLSVRGDAELAKIDLMRIHPDDFNGDGFEDIYLVNGWNTTEDGTIFLNLGNN